MWTPREIPDDWKSVRSALFDACPGRPPPPGPDVAHLEAAARAVRTVEASIKRLPEADTNIHHEYVLVVNAALQLARFGAILQEDLKFRPTWEAMDALHANLFWDE